MDEVSSRLWENILGGSLPRAAPNYLRRRDEVDFILWTSRRVNIPVIIEAHQPLLIRHNDPEELFTLDVGKWPVPAIIGTKIAGELRRRMHQLLRDAYKMWSGEIDGVLEKIEEGYKYGGKYECGVSVVVDEKRGEEKLSVGYCKRCPSCALMGYAVERGEDVNSISRVDKDTFYATKKLTEATIKITRNRVDDVAFITGQSLFELNAVKPGTLFVGVIVLRDVTLAETLFTLKAISELERIGAAKTIFGGIRTHIPLVAFANGRIASGYEIAETILETGLGGDDPLEETKKIIVKTFQDRIADDQMYIGEIAGLMREKPLEQFKDVIIEAWQDAAVRRKMVLEVARKARK